MVKDNRVESLKSVLYVSRCTFGAFDIHDLDILRTALHRNALVGINGFLYRSKSHYFQHIDGPANEINRLLDRLHADTRHSEVTVLMENQIQFSRFPGWSMGYSCHGPSDCGSIVTQSSDPETILDFLLSAANRQNESVSLESKTEFLFIA